jgi:hypothetical protein
MFELSSFTELSEICSSGMLHLTVVFFEIGLKNELIFEEERFLSILVSYESKENVII